MYQYKAKLIRVIDGDTVDLKVDLGFKVFVEIRFRLNGIDTPETRGDEKEAGLAAKKFLIEALGDRDIKVASEKTGKFGRWLGTLFVAGSDINELMINQGHAVPYNGGKKS
ncbi:MAG: nuclease [Planctomycetes bacterium]|nr:nuclease [Planctomycetota bacterium]